MDDRRGLECVLFVESPRGARPIAAALAESGGRVVKSDDHLVMGTFGDPGAAVRFLASALAAGGVRAGAQVGDVSHEAGDVFGMAVHIAKRLCETSAWDRALLSEMTVSLADAAPVTPVGALELRGVAEAVEAVEIGPTTTASETGELRAIAVTDLMGSTAMRSALGDARADEVRREHFRSLEVLAGAHNGHVRQTTGDGLVVEFDSVVDAAAAALGFHQAAARDQRSPVRIRVGVDVGPATGATGAAAALSDVAGHECPRLGDSAAALLSPHREFTLTPAPPGHDLLATGEPGIIELPPALGARDRGQFVGRETERASLAASIERANEGDGLLVLVAGEAGIGKSRLVRETARDAHEDGAAVLLGRCDEQPLTPYQPFVEALSHYVSTAPIDDLGLRTRALPELALLLPELARRLPGLAPRTVGNAEEDRYQLFEAVTGLLDGLARDRRLVVILEDLHWADTSTLQLLRHVCRTGAGSGLALVGSYRTSEVGRGHPLAALSAELREAGLLERLELGGLGAAAVAQLATQRLHAGGVERMTERLLDRTEGNPFFLHELLRHLEDSPAPSEAEASGPLSVTEGIRDVVGRRLDRLPEQTRKLLTIAGAAGREFDRALVERAAGLGTLDALDALEEGIAAEIIVDVPGAPGRYRFVHALMREAVEEELGHDRRAVVHLRLAVTLEEQSGADDSRLAELSRHFFAAGRGGDPVKAARYSTLAAQRAAALFAPEEAAEQLERALQGLEWSGSANPDQCYELLLNLASARVNSGDRRGAREAARDAAALARQLGDADRLAHAALWAEGGWVPVGSSDPETIALLEDALGSLGTSEDALRARVLAAHAMQTYYLDPDAADASTAEAVDLARRSGDSLALGRALHARHYTLRGTPRTLNKRLEMMDELLELARESGNREQEGLARLWGAADHVEGGDLPAFDSEVQELTRTALELRRPLYAFWAARLEVFRALMVGEFDRAAELIPHVLELGERAGETNALPQAYAQRCALAISIGGGRELAAEIDQLGLKPAIGWAGVTASLRATDGDREGASRAVDALAAEGFRGLPNDAFTPMVTAHMAETVAILGRAEDAAQLVTRLDAIGDGNVITPTATSYVGPGSFFSGLLMATLGRHHEAVGAYQHALLRTEALGARPTTARIELALARSLLAERDTSATEHAARGLAIAEELGMPRVEAAAREVLLACASAGV